MPNKLHFPDAVQRDSGAPLIRDRRKSERVTIPGLQRTTSFHHNASKTRVNALVVLRSARETWH